MNKFKKWLFFKALDFVLNNINKYEDKIMYAMGVDPRLAKIIDTITDELLKLYVKWRGKVTKDQALMDMPKLEQLTLDQKLDPYQLRRKWELRK